MQEYLDRYKQTPVGWAIAAGAVLSALGLISSFFVFVASLFSASLTRGADGHLVPSGPATWTGFTFGILALGLLLLVGGMAYLHRENQNEKIGTEKVFEGAKVQARYAITPTGDLLHELWEMDDFPDLKYYVRVSLPDEEAVELQVDEEVFETLGEGLVGTLHTKGRWVTRFDSDLASFQPAYEAAVPAFQEE